MVSLSQFRDFIAYWLELRGNGRRLPFHKDFRPARITPLLPRLLIAEHVAAENHFTVRLAGTEVVERLGREITNTEFGDEMRDTQGVWKVTTQALDDMVTHPVSVMGRRRWHTRLGHYYCDFLYLPFRGRDGSPCELFLLGDFSEPVNSPKALDFVEFGDVIEAYAIDLGNGVPDSLKSLPSLSISS